MMKFLRQVPKRVWVWLGQAVILAGFLIDVVPALDKPWLKLVRDGVLLFVIILVIGQIFRHRSLQAATEEAN